MIRVDEATSARPESRYSLGLYTATLLLGTLTSAIALHTEYRSLPQWATFAVSGVLGLLLGFVFAARPALGDSVRTLSPGEATACWLLSVALFMCSSVIFKRWSPITGLVALQLPAMITLVMERGYARYYVLCGATLAFTLTAGRTPTGAAVAAIGLFMLLMLITMAYENFFFALENAPPGAQFGISAWLPLRTAVVRFLIAALVTAPFAWLTPVPELSASRAASGPRFRPAMSGNIDTSFTLLETFLYTMLLILMLLALGAFLRWLRNRRRRRREGLPAESIGMPVGEFRPVDRIAPAPPPDLTTPIGKVIHWYDRFSEAAGRRGRSREPHETPEEFQQILLEQQAVPEAALGDITRRFEKARYAPGEVTNQEAHEFQLLVEETLSRMSSAPTPLPD